MAYRSPTMPNTEASEGDIRVINVCDLLHAVHSIYPAHDEAAASRWVYQRLQMLFGGFCTRSAVPPCLPPCPGPPSVCLDRLVTTGGLDSIRVLIARTSPTWSCSQDALYDIIRNTLNTLITSRTMPFGKTEQTFAKIPSENFFLGYSSALYRIQYIR